MAMIVADRCMQHDLARVVAMRPRTHIREPLCQRVHRFLCHSHLSPHPTLWRRVKIRATSTNADKPQAAQTQTSNINGNSNGNGRAQSGDASSSTTTSTQSQAVQLNEASGQQRIDCIATGMDVQCQIQDDNEPITSSSQQPVQLASPQQDNSLLNQLGAVALLISPFFFWGTSMVAMKVNSNTPLYLIRHAPCMMLSLQQACAMDAARQ